MSPKVGAAVPTPLVGAEVDLKDFPFTPIFRARLFGSAFHARASDAEWRAGVTLWMKSWDQHPAGSLPTDGIELCRLAELGRDLKSWKKVKAGALHGWFLCSDGRLYHAVVAEGVNEAWRRKIDQRMKTAKARIERLKRRLQDETDPDETERLRQMIRELQQSLSQTGNGFATEGAAGQSQTENGSVTDDATEDVTASVTGSKRREGKGIEENKRKPVAAGSESESAPRAPRTPPPAGDGDLVFSGKVNRDRRRASSSAYSPS